ncbi:MAG: ABC transporter ATP-binding protein [Planctomycetaceae bacterium]|nr:ABC transporter ATP-binding protein [Planctomycetaceae bacterium]
MNDDIAISVQDVSKAYRLYAAPKDRLVEWLHPFRRKLHREFWALRNVSFDVPRGATVGIIGRNGSGKSTLLELLCSVLRPTSGAVCVKGRVAPLLALGAGFNPDFTGRDNVSFQCRVLGLPEGEIRRLLPQIEAFADIGQFFEQPIKTYSSGMFVRLAFAAAIHVAPDILIIDEVLAVGDAGFQRKCYQKVLDFQAAGKTILLVSHDLSAIVGHCSRAILLDGGRVICDGDPNDVTNVYLEMLSGGRAGQDGAGVAAAPAPIGLATDEAFIRDVPGEDRCARRASYNPGEHRYGDGRAGIVDYLIECGGRQDPAVVDSGATIVLHVKTTYCQDVGAPMFGFSVKTVDGVVLYGTNSLLQNVRIPPARAGQTLVVKFSFTLPLNVHDVFIDLGAADAVGGGVGDSIPLDRRYDVIHLGVVGRENCSGLYSCGAAFEEVARIGPPDAAPGAEG